MVKEVDLSEPSKKPELVPTSKRHHSSLYSDGPHLVLVVTASGPRKVLTVRPEERVASAVGDTSIFGGNGGGGQGPGGRGAIHIDRRREEALAKEIDNLEEALAVQAEHTAWLRERQQQLLRPTQSSSSSIAAAAALLRPSVRNVRSVGLTPRGSSPQPSAAMDIIPLPSAGLIPTTEVQNANGSVSQYGATSLRSADCLDQSACQSEEHAQDTLRSWSGEIVGPVTAAPSPRRPFQPQDDLALPMPQPQAESSGLPSNFALEPQELQPQVTPLLGGPSNGTSSGSSRSLRQHFRRALLLEPSLPPPVLPSVDNRSSASDFGSGSGSRENSGSSLLDSRNPTTVGGSGIGFGSVESSAADSKNAVESAVADFARRIREDPNQHIRRSNQLAVSVVAAEGLRPLDLGGRADPFVAVSVVSLKRRSFFASPLRNSVTSASKAFSFLRFTSSSLSTSTTFEPTPTSSRFEEGRDMRVNPATTNGISASPIAALSTPSAGSAEAGGNSAAEMSMPAAAAAAAAAAVGAAAAAVAAAAASAAAAAAAAAAASSANEDEDDESELASPPWVERSTYYVPNSLNPKWDRQQFVLSLGSDAMANPKDFCLKLRVLDRTVFHGSETLGVATVSLVKLEKEEVIDTDLHILIFLHVKPRRNGVLRLILSARKNHAQAFEAWLPLQRVGGDGGRLHIKAHWVRTLPKLIGYRISILDGMRAETEKMLRERR